MARKQQLIKWRRLNCNHFLFRSQLVYLNGGNTRFLVVAFNPIIAADLGQKYTCLATNILGTVSQEYVLNGKLGLKGQTT